MNTTTYITEKDKNGKPRYYRVIDGKKKVISRAEYKAHTCDTDSENDVVNVASVCEVEDNAQIAFEETAASADVSNGSPVENTVQVAEADGEPIRKDVAFEIVKGIVDATGGKHSEKLCLQHSKKCDLVCYRNRVVCTFMFDKQGEIAAVKFMGATIETRKEPSIYALQNCNDLHKYKDDILKQIEFIDLWYLNVAKRKVS